LVVSEGGGERIGSNESKIYGGVVGINSLYFLILCVKSSTLCGISCVRASTASFCTPPSLSFPTKFPAFVPNVRGPAAPFPVLQLYRVSVVMGPEVRCPRGLYTAPPTRHGSPSLSLHRTGGGSPNQSSPLPRLQGPVYMLKPPWCGDAHGGGHGSFTLASFPLLDPKHRHGPWKLAPPLSLHPFLPPRTPPSSDLTTQQVGGRDRVLRLAPRCDAMYRLMHAGHW